MSDAGEQDRAASGRRGSDVGTTTAPAPAPATAPGGTGSVVPAVPAAAPASLPLSGLGAQKFLTKDDVDMMGGSLKIHVKLNLSIDIRVTADIKGDIVLAQRIALDSQCSFEKLQQVGHQLAA